MSEEPQRILISDIVEALACRIQEEGLSKARIHVQGPDGILWTVDIVATSPSVSMKGVN